MVHPLESLEIQAAAARQRATSARLCAELAANLAKSIEYRAAARLALKGIQRPTIDCEETSEKLLRALEHAHARSVDADVAEHSARQLEQELQRYLSDENPPMAEDDNQAPLNEQTEFLRRAIEFAERAQLEAEKAYNNLRSAKAAVTPSDRYTA